MFACRGWNLIAVAAVGLLISAGGCHRCCVPLRQSFRPAVPVAPPPCASGCGPRTAVPVYPPVVPPTQPLPPAPAGPDAPAATGFWQPVPGGPYPRGTDIGPIPVPGTNGGVTLRPPDQGNGVDLKPPVPMKPAPEDQPPAGHDFPPDIPRFAWVDPGKVAAGLEPFPEGFDWLRQRGFRTVVHVRPTGEDNTETRRLVESKGLKYVPLTVSPQTLDRELVAEFGRAVRDEAGQPVFVCDRRGPLAGALWYLHFRLNDNLPDAEARARALRLGLKEETDGDAAELWLAINRLLKGM